MKEIKCDFCGGNRFSEILDDDSHFKLGYYDGYGDGCSYYIGEYDICINCRPKLMKILKLVKMKLDESIIKLEKE